MKNIEKLPTKEDSLVTGEAIGYVSPEEIQLIMLKARKKLKPELLGIEQDESLNYSPYTENPTDFTNFRKVS